MPLRFPTAHMKVSATPEKNAMRPPRTTTPTREIIDIKGLSLGCAAGRSILENLDWTVKAGEHWVILGPNGSGKTTLLGAITGYLHESTGIPAGRLCVLDHEYGRADWRELRKSVGIVGSGLRQLIPDDHTALGVVATGRQALLQIWHELPAAHLREARRMLRLTECATLEDRAWAVLSQGERQRVLIARALMAKPRILILDEPCAGLDPVARENFLGFVSRIAAAPTAPALILVTHHVEEILPCFTHALCLRAGRVVAAGSKSSVMKTSTMRDTFGHAVTLSARAGRYALKVKADSGVAA